MQESELRYRIRHYPQAGDFVLKGRLTRRVTAVYRDGVVEYEDQDARQGCVRAQAWQSWTYHATLFVAGDVNKVETTMVSVTERKELAGGSSTFDDREDDGKYAGGCETT